MARIMITGANRGIGLALTERYARRGDVVIAGCRDPAAAEDLQSLRRTADGSVQVARLDVTDSATIEEAAANASDEPVDILINNAGIIDPRTNSSLDVDCDELLNAFAVNTIGPLRVARAFLPHLRRARSPKIATITSRMSLGRSSDQLAYRTSKLAVNRVMEALAGDLRGDRITVLLIHPGWVRTAMGGRSAPVAPAESARRISDIIDRADTRSTGRFFDIDGSEVTW